MRNRLHARTLATAALIGAAAAVISSSGTATAAPTAPAPSVQKQIDTHLRDFPGGVQASPNMVSYNGGRVTLTFPNEVGRAAAVDPCASDAYCFYDGPDFTGRKLTFRDCGGWQYLTDYGFGDKTSSWVNNVVHQTLVYDEGTSPRTQLWTMNAKTASANVGTAAYNKADSFLTYCG